MGGLFGVAFLGSNAPFWPLSLTKRVVFTTLSSPTKRIVLPLIFFRRNAPSSMAHPSAEGPKPFLHLSCKEGMLMATAKDKFDLSSSLLLLLFWKDLGCKCFPARQTEVLLWKTIPRRSAPPGTDSFCP